MGRDRRKKILVEPYLQLKFGLVFVCLNLIFSILVLSLFGYYMWDMFSSIQNYFQLNAAQSLMTLEKFYTPALIGLLTITIFVIFTIYLSIHYTHSIYGPIVSIKKMLENTIAGCQPKTINIRKTDQLKDLVTLINQLNESSIYTKEHKSYIEINKFLDSLLAQSRPKSMKVKKEDLMYSISSKLEKIYINNLSLH